MSQPAQALVNANNNQILQGIVIVPRNIYYFAWLALQQVVLNPSLAPVNINTDTFSSRVINNVQSGVYSLAIAASDINAISTLIILLLPRLVILTLTPAVEPHSFQNRHRYARNILTILRNCTALVGVVLPLEFHGRNVRMIRALKALPDLSILKICLPTTFTSTPWDIRCFQSLLAVHLRGFNQIQDLRAPNPTR